MTRPSFTLKLLAMLALAAASAPTGAAEGEVVAVAGSQAGAPILWNGGVAWPDFDGIHAVTPGSAPRRLISFHSYSGLTFNYALDSGIGAGGASGALAYDWEEANDQTPPMGPGDTNVPSPPIPYETAVTRRGVIRADGHAATLPSWCSDPLLIPSAEVSLAGGAVAYSCTGVPPGAPPVPPQASALPAYLALSEIGALGTSTGAISEIDGTFQISGGFIAYHAGPPFAPNRIVVENLASKAIAYQIPQSIKERSGYTLALQEDGTLVVLGMGTSNCEAGASGSESSYPAVWYSVASPVAHQLGCFYDGALRPVGGRWVALAPGPGRGASLELVDLAGGAGRTLAVLPNPEMFEPQQHALTAAADFDGKQLAWALQTCDGVAMQFTADVAQMSPGPPLSARCPVLFHLHGALRVSAKGVLRVPISCALGCDGFLSIAKPRALHVEDLAFFSLPASATPRTISCRLSRRQLAYLRGHHRGRITLAAEASSLGNARDTRYTARVTLTR